MKFFLQIKHWQLFIITWGLTCITILLAFIKPGIALTLIPFLLITGSIGFFGWLWSIGTYFHTSLPAESKLNLGLFQWLFVIPVTYMIALIIWMGMVHFHYFPDLNEISATSIATIIVPLHLLTLIIIAWVIIFVSKTIKMVELNSTVTFQQYSTIFFQIWFSIVGVWMLQPKINSLSRQKPFSSN